MVQIFDELSDSLCQVADLAEFIRFAHPLNEYSAAAEHASVAISRIVEKSNTNTNLYKALKNSIEKDILPTTDVDTLVAKLFLFDFEQSGIHLSAQKRNQVVELNNQILSVGQQFHSGVAKPTVVNRSTLPENVRNM